MTQPSCWPDWLNDIWAKSADKGADGQPESLAQHTWDVLSRLTEMIHLRPDLPEQLKVPRLWHSLFWAAFLHDFGKAASGFQARLRGGAQWPHRHEVLSLAFFDWVADGLTPEEQAWTVAAIVSHHKDAAEIADLYPPPDDPEYDQLVARVAELEESTIRSLWRWLAECGVSWVKDLALTQAGVTMPALPSAESALAIVQLMGVKRINAWLKTYQRFVRQIERSEDRKLVIGTLALRGHIINADHSASAHAGALPRAEFDAQMIIASRKLDAANLYGHQSVAWQTAGSALLTAPTGSGKTEAALLWATRQAMDSGGLPRLFYTLPYQASMNAMQLRLQESFGQDNVGLQHGRGLLALYRLLLERDYSPVQAARQARQARDLSRLNYPPVRVFSPYQMLKGMYRLKGYEALLSDYHGAAFIFDEIHAYEVKRLAMILKTIQYLAQNYNARFLVMTATFPSLVKRWLREALDAPAEIVADSALFAEFRRHRLHLLDGELLSDEGLKRITDDALTGKSVLVVFNLVDRAQRAYHQLDQMLTRRGIHVELLHGRFNMRDRSAKEALVRDATGSKSEHRRSIVLVATQAVEVSLDIDLDTIYTDPAPLEALVQRFGRINRRCKQAGLASVYVYRLPDDGQKIYDATLVQRTLAILGRENGNPLDESAVGAWLDEIYSGEIAERWQKEYDHAAGEFEATCVRSLRAFQADRGLTKLFYEAFDSIEVLPEALYDEYLTLKEEDPIRANELLVSISWGRYCALMNNRQMWPYDREEDREMPPVTRAPYDSELGLVFDLQREEED